MVGIKEDHIMINKVIKAFTLVFVSIFLILILVSIKVDRIAELSYFDILLFLQLIKYFAVLVIPMYLYLLLFKLFKK